MFSKTLCLLVLPFALALLAGAVLPFQAAGNAAVGRALGHWLWGAFTSLTVSSLVVIAALLILRVPAPDMGKALQGPWWLWVGGVLGALYVAGAAALTPGWAQRVSWCWWWRGRSSRRWSRTTSE